MPRPAYDNFECISQMKRLRNIHHGRRKTYTEIARKLNTERKYASPAGVIGGWYATSVKNILERRTPPKKKKRVRKLGITKKDHLTVAQAADLHAWAMEQSQGRGYRARRTGRIVLGLLLTGVRRAELCKLRIKDMPAHHGKNGIDVRGKGNTLGTVRITPAARKVFDQCCCKRRSGYVFVNEAGKKYQPQSINAILRGVGRKTNLPFLHPHILRHTYASILVWAGCDIVFVKKQLRHLNIATTDIYTSVIEEPYSDDPDAKIADLLRAINPKHPENLYSL